MQKLDKCVNRVDVKICRKYAILGTIGVDTPEILPSEVWPVCHGPPGSTEQLCGLLLLLDGAELGREAQRRHHDDQPDADRHQRDLGPVRGRIGERTAGPEDVRRHRRAKDLFF